MWQRALSILAVILATTGPVGCASKDDAQKPAPPPLWGEFPNARPSCVKGIHLTSWYVGSPKGRAQFEKLLAETELNTVVIDIKETEGEVFIPGVKLDKTIDVYEKAMPQIADYLKFLKARGVYTIARIVVFKDTLLAKKKPEWAIHSSSALPKAAQQHMDPSVWVDYKGNAWADPYNWHVWNYNIEIAERAADLGFQEIQFDYIRFPSDGNTKLCRYSQPHSAAASVQALEKFLERAHQRLKPKGVDLSIDVFGLTGTTSSDMGIGQQLSRLLRHVDIICPMMYPSHYGKGEYGIPDPNSAPYDTIFQSIKDTQKKLVGTKVQLRPYFQDFSLGVKYTPTMVREQMKAAYDLGVGEWLLWNASCRYTKDALLPDPHQQ